MTAQIKHVKQSDQKEMCRPTNIITLNERKQGKREKNVENERTKLR